MIGGMHFLIRHAPLLTYDVDLWIEDSNANRGKAERALAALDAEWGATDADWGPVATKLAGWLSTQAVFCLNSPHGAIDIFRAVAGLGGWRASAQSGIDCITAGGIAYRGHSDADNVTMSDGARSHTAEARSSDHLETKAGSSMSQSLGDLKQREETKRERNWDAATRWQVIQGTIAWAEQQATARRNTPAACLARQRRLLDQVACRQMNHPA